MRCNAIWVLSSCGTVEHGMGNICLPIYWQTNSILLHTRYAFEDAVKWTVLSDAYSRVASGVSTSTYYRLLMSLNCIRRAATTDGRFQPIPLAFQLYSCFAGRIRRVRSHSCCKGCCKLAQTRRTEMNILLPAVCIIAHMGRMCIAYIYLAVHTHELNSMHFSFDLRMSWEVGVGSWSVRIWYIIHLVLVRLRVSWWT